MVSFILRRIAGGVALVVAVSVIAFLLLHVGAGDVARRILGQDATAANVDQMRMQLGLDRPLIAQFLDWAGGVVSGNLGVSWFGYGEVADSIASRLSVTLTLVIGALIVAAVVSLVLGIAAARSRGWIDRAVQAVTVLGYAIPGFLIALFLVRFFGIGLQWFPATGYVDPSASISGWVNSITLPVIALSLACIASVTAQIRGSFIDAMRQDYVRTLHSRGLSAHRIAYGHVLRNSAGPAVAVLGVQFISLLGGAFIVEQVFAIPGLGQIAVSATLQGDVPLVMGLVVVTTILVVAINVVLDIVHGLLNPKVQVR